MKPSAAFSVGLWTGAAVVAAVGWFYMQNADRSRSSAFPAAHSELAAKSEQIRVLERENARLMAEAQSLRETASALKNNLAVRATVRQRQRVPIIPLSEATETAPAASVSENWIEQAITSADATMLPQLEEAALKNNRHALEALALLADQDQAAALMRVWRSGSLTLSNQVDATRYLAATMEVNPGAEQLLRGLALDPKTDARVLYAAVEGLANLNFSLSSGREFPAPHTKADLSERIRVLDNLWTAITDENLRAFIDQKRDDLQGHLAEPAPAAQ